jgi:hypothetical protein
LYVLQVALTQQTRRLQSGVRVTAGAVDVTDVPVLLQMELDYAEEKQRVM